jgi:hypothetical protein
MDKEGEMPLLLIVSAVAGWRLWPEKHFLAWGAICIGIGKIGWDLQWGLPVTIVPDPLFIAFTIINIALAVGVFALFRWLRLRRGRKASIRGDINRYINRQRERQHHRKILSDPMARLTHPEDWYAARAEEERQRQENGPRP